jgi:hypothetical protein
MFISRGTPTVPIVGVRPERRSRQPETPVYNPTVEIAPNTTEKIYNIIPIVVSVNYDDLLRVTLEFNRAMFDKYVIVTDVQDHATKRVCEEYGAECMESNKTYENGAKFNKSGLIHEAQRRLHHAYPFHWILLMDADIILPRNFPTLVEKIDQSYLYCMNRRDFETPDDWKRNVYRVYDCVENYPGYFQLYYNKSKLYAPFSPAGDICDFVFAKQFSRRRILAPDSFVTHLGEANRNITGRFTARWE